LSGEFKVPESIRSRLARPLGLLITNEDILAGGLADAVKRSSMVVSVGDRVTESIAALGRVPDVQVVDGREKRQERAPPAVPYSSLLQATNPPGSITAEAVEAIRNAFGGAKPARVLIRGEEDLLAIPAVLFAPIGASIFYGQPNEGVVVVKVDAPAKARSRAILKEVGMGDTPQTGGPT